jgi:hypothetical protein
MWSCWYCSQETEAWYNDFLTSGHHCRCTRDNTNPVAINLITGSLDIFYYWKKYQRWHKEPPPCRTWIWGQADRTQRLIVMSLFSVEFSPIVTNAYILIFLFMSRCNAPNSLQKLNRPFCQCSMMLPMVKTKGNGTERVYKAFNYTC